jgi:hypothetical protein
MNSLPMPKPAGRWPKPDGAPPKPAAFDDRAVMVVGILGFGLTIPWLTGLYGPIGPGDALFWAGQIGFIALAAAIYLGNRWLLLEQRKHLDWFNQPLRKPAMLVAANVLYTAPVTVLGLVLWYRAAGMPVDAGQLQLVVLTNVICVLFVTHAYETMFLIREREGDLLHVTRLEQARAQAGLAALKAQTDPHFLFNSLNTLGHLITQDAPRAREFCDTLAEVYRYVLASRERDLVPLADELAFLRRYHRLLELRFGPALPLEGAAEVEGAARGWLVAPLALQGLLENAVKHNQASAAEPLPVRLTLEPGMLVMVNTVRPRRQALPSAGVGLANLDERCRLVAGRALEVRREGGRFEARVPLVALP